MTAMPVCTLDALPPGACRAILAEGAEILVCNADGDYFAVENICPHAGLEFCSPEGSQSIRGCLEGDELICPHHGAGFCLRTGEVTRPPAYESLRTFPVTVKEGILYVSC